MSINISSFNLRGFRSGVSMLRELCNNHSIVGIQEHWLRPDELSKLSVTDTNFECPSASGMSGALTRGALTGRPFGGVAFLWHSSLSNCIEVVNNDIEGRCCVIKLNLINRTVLFFNLYLPCFDGSSEYKNDLCFYAGFITDVLESVDHN